LLDPPSPKINKCIKIEKNEDRQNKNRKKLKHEANINQKKTKNYKTIK
jgi:hypothetical protein